MFKIQPANKFSHFLYYQFPPIAIAVAIFVLSSFSKLPDIDLEFKLKDKVYHAIAYCIFTYFIARGLYFRTKIDVFKTHFFTAAIILGALYGISDEVHQHFVPGRIMDFWDAVADGVGAVIGAYFFKMRVKVVT